MAEMLKCRDVGQLLQDYVDGLLDPAMRQALEAHLADCPGCLAFINTYQQTIRLSSDLRPEDMPLELRQKLRSFIQAKLAPHHPSLWERLRSRLAGS